MGVCMRWFCLDMNLGCTISLGEGCFGMACSVV